MLSNAFLKTLRDQRISGSLWLAGMLAITAYVVFLFPVIAEQAEELNKLIENLPEAILALAGGVIDYSTLNGFLAAEFFSILGPIIFLVYAVIHGSGTIAGEEERGTLALLLANPISRTRLLLHKAAAIVAALVTGAMTLWLGLIAWAAIAGIEIGAWKVFQGCLSIALLGIFFGMLSLAVGAATGRRGISSGVALAAGVATYLVNAFAPLISWLEPGRLATPFYYYGGSGPVLRGLNPLHVVVLLAASAALLAVAVWAFERRDLTR